MIFMLYVLFLRISLQYLCMETETQKNVISYFVYFADKYIHISLNTWLKNSFDEKNNKKRIKRKSFSLLFKITDFKSKEREEEEEKVEMQRMFVWFWFLCVLKKERKHKKNLLVKDSLSYRSFEVDRIILHFQHHHIHRS